MYRAQNRDISEKIALGLAKPTMSKESMMDSRLFNQEQYSNSMGDEDSYNLYDKPLFTGSSAAAAIYKPMTSNEGQDDDAGAEESIKGAMKNDRFGLGVAGRGFEGAADQEVRPISLSLVFTNTGRLMMNSVAKVQFSSSGIQQSQILSVSLLSWNRQRRVSSVVWILAVMKLGRGSASRLVCVQCSVMMFCLVRR